MDGVESCRGGERTLTTTLSCLALPCLLLIPLCLSGSESSLHRVLLHRYRHDRSPVRWPTSSTMRRARARAFSCGECVSDGDSNGDVCRVLVTHSLTANAWCTHALTVTRHPRGSRCSTRRTPTLAVSPSSSLLRWSPSLGRSVCIFLCTPMTTTAPRSFHPIFCGLECAGSAWCGACGLVWLDLDPARHWDGRSISGRARTRLTLRCPQTGDRSMEIHKGIWNKKSAGCYEVRGKTLGIVG